MDAVQNSVSLQELGTADDIVNVAMFLASPIASYISGFVLHVDAD